MAFGVTTYKKTNRVWTMSHIYNASTDRLRRFLYPAVALLCLSLSAVPVLAADGAAWVTAWGTSQQNLGQTVISNASVRMMARITVPGQSVRIRLDNAYGSEPLAISSAFVGQRMAGAELIPDSNQRLLFGGLTTVTIPAGGSVQSDAVTMQVQAYQDLAISLHTPGTGVQPSQHAGALVTSYLSANGSGDVTGSISGEEFTETTASMFWLKSVDVLTDSADSVIVGFGDSITDGSCTTLDGHDRWQDWLGYRLNVNAGASGLGYTAIVNEGIGGNTVIRAGLQPAPASTPGTERLQRDVLSHAGVTHVVLFMGTNDIRRGASAASVIEGVEQIVRQLKARGLKVIAATIIPRHNTPPGSTFVWDSSKTAIRNEVNQWIRSEADFDAVLDFDRVVHDSDPNRIFPAYNCDGIHPNVLGYYEMGRQIPLELFR